MFPAAAGHRRTMRTLTRRGRGYTYRAIPVVYPDGQLVGFLLHIAGRWFGPFVSLDAFVRRS